MDQVYKVGSKGPVIKALQVALNSKNSAGLKVTGIFDNETFEAFKAYQRRQGLNGTGEFTKADRVWRLLAPIEHEEPKQEDQAFDVETEPLKEAEEIPFEVVPTSTPGKKAAPHIPSNKSVKKG